MVKFILQLLIDDEYPFNILTNILLVSSILFVNINKRYQICKSINSESLGKILIDTSINYTFTELFILLIPKLNILNLNYLFTKENFGNSLNIILWSIGYIFIHIFINIFNELNITNYCRTPIYGYPYDIYPFIILLVSYIYIKVFLY
jgi:hypothetical protein